MAHASAPLSSTLPRLVKLLFALLVPAAVAAAPTPALERAAGLREAPPNWHAFTEAKLVIRPGQVIERGTLLVKDGRIVAAGAAVAVPAGARVWPLGGRSVYAGFIDLASPLGVPETLREAPAAAPPADPFTAPAFGVRAGPPRAAPVARALASRNPLLRAEQQVATQLELRPEALAAARRLGFTAVLAAPSYGLLRGQGALLALGEAAEPGRLLLAAAPSQHLGMDLGGFGQMPSSLMGAVAVLRQSLLDARWLQQQKEPPVNATLQALQPLLAGRQLVIAQAREEQDLGRWLALREEFALPAARFVLQGTGHEYRQLERLARAGAPLLLPLDFPEPPPIHPDSAPALHLLQHWEAAPSNAALLQAAGLRFALTAQGAPSAQFWPRLRQAVRRGLSADAALAALTTTPAELLGETQRLGTLEAGRLAHAVVMSGDPFSDAEAEALISVVGEQVFVHPGWAQAEAGDPRGRWQDGAGRSLVLSGSRTQPAARLDEQACSLRTDDLQGAPHWQLRCGARWIQATLRQGEILEGLQRDHAQAPWQTWQARRVAAAEAPKADAAQPADEPPLTQFRSTAFPYGAYGIETPAAQTTLLRGATLWTQGPAGTLSDTDLLLQGGRIAHIGRGLAAPAGALEVDARGLHVTPGLIDAHSHIAVSRAINEFSDAITAEVRIADALDATDINLYRQLAGGVTTANVLHGSANAIGGQSQLIKLRWGRPAAELAFAGAPPSIKFALGENVKESNRSSPSTRYPQTRMGVEQLLIDAFAQAADYAAQDPRTRRRDLRLEALAELLAGTRSIHVHSYRADEILMFAGLARELKLKVAAFQHVLEGYKVAGTIAALGAGASTFSDWWGFKAESADAVVGNAGMLAQAGVLTSLNSDDAELARRLNAEAAKALRDGRLSPEQALALVTLNPARQLGVDAWVGSLEEGKQADVVLWSGPPLSILSRVNSTWVDGRRLFDRAQDAQLRLRDARERERLLARVAQASAKSGAAPSTTPASPALQQLLAQAQQLARQAHGALHSEYADRTPVHQCLDGDAP
jgi:imidazolonepropionase-like amidohydrolase